MASRDPRCRRLSAGRKLDDKFEIVGVLGEGGMGIVYDARRIAEGDRVALKVIHQHLAGRPADPRPLRARGRDPAPPRGRPPLPGARLRRDRPTRGARGRALLYMALPRIDGPALDAVLKKEGPLPLVRAVTIVLDVCEALREAHAQGVIHRDLKPGNVLLREGDRAVVVDFGMAKIVTGGGTGTTALTQHNMVFGTPEYMAPEQARGDELDARCDVYATGIILYELLTGRRALLRADAAQRAHRAPHEAAQPPRTRAPDGDLARRSRRSRCTRSRRTPRERYATAGALAMAVRTALASPQDVEGVRPASRVNVAVDTTDAHSATLPAPMPVHAAVPTPRPAPLPSVQPAAAAANGPRRSGSSSASSPRSPASRSVRGSRCAAGTECGRVGGYCTRRGIGAAGTKLPRPVPALSDRTAMRSPLLVPLVLCVACAASPAPAPSPPVVRAASAAARRRPPRRRPCASRPRPTPPPASRRAADTPDAAPPAPACPQGEVWIPPTSAEGFVMGKGIKGEHRVVLTHGFCMDANEVSVRDYTQCVEAGACKEPWRGDP